MKTKSNVEGNMKIMQQNMMKSKEKPIFADEVMIMSQVKVSMIDGKLKKDGHITIAFMDVMSQQPVAKIVLSPITATSLQSSLVGVLKTLDKEVTDKTLPDKKKVEDVAYIR